MRSAAPTALAGNRGSVGFAVGASGLRACSSCCARNTSGAPPSPASPSIRFRGCAVSQAGPPVGDQLRDGRSYALWSVSMTRLESGPVPVIMTPSDGTVHWTMAGEPNPR
jgi:hypothetical protein